MQEVERVRRHADPVAGGRVSTTDPAVPGERSGSRSIRSSEIWRCTCVTALTGGAPPYSSSARRSIDTIRFASSSRIARTDLCRGPPRRMGPSGELTSRGPRMRKTSPRRRPYRSEGGDRQAVAAR